MRLRGAVAVAGRVSDAGTAGGGGRTGGRLGFNLQPLVPQSFGEVVVHRHTDGELLRVSLLVVGSQAPLEVFLHVVVAALGNHWEREEGVSKDTTLVVYSVVHVCGPQL